MLSQTLTTLGLSLKKAMEAIPQNTFHSSFVSTAMLMFKGKCQLACQSFNVSLIYFRLKKKCDRLSDSGSLAEGDPFASIHLQLSSDDEEDGCESCQVEAS